MYKITDAQIEFIADDLRARGISIAGIHENLLDHVCCIIENELQEDGDFESLYSRTIKTFYTSEMSEIENEAINLLIHKNFNAMKKIMLVSGGFAALLLSAGLVFKFLHWPGAGLGIVIGILMMSFVFLPLLLKLKLSEKHSATDKLIAITGTVAGIFASLWVLFKINHWPGANAIGLFMLGIMLLLFLPVYYFTGIRKADSRVNTTVVSLLILMGCGLMFTLIRTPQATRNMLTMQTASFLRSEQILTAERMSVKNELSASGGQVFNLCEDIKKRLIKRETGLIVIGADFALKKQFLGETEVQESFYKSDGTDRLGALKDQIASYNANLTLGQLPIIAVNSVIANPRTKIPDALNDLIQIQMMVLQNERSAGL